MMAKSYIWLFLIASLAFQLNAKQNSLSFRNRRQHISQQNLLNSPSLYNSHTNDDSHFNQQVDLARLQHFLTRSNITLGTRSIYYEHGNWTEWSEPSECSRKCGGGVISQSRTCLDNNCLGPSKKYFSCNVEDCDPNEIDFREKQCAEFDKELFKGRYLTWTPYLQAQNPCELNCMPKGERFYYKHLDKVIDGTKCFNDGSLDVCVDGQCMPVGCDNQLGSTKQADECGVCGGDETSCNIISGIYDNNNLRTGYNDLFTIPAGARNIKIKEIVPTSNYLAIRSIKGNYHLNGNWKIEFSRPLKFAGTVFNYVRKSNSHETDESLTSVGPINEPLVVVLLYQERNRGIMFKYSIKKNETPISTIYDPQLVTGNEIDRIDRYYNSQYPNNRGTHQYVWWNGDYTPCTKQCGSGGQQQRRVICLKVPTSNIANMSTHELPSNSETVEDQYCDSRRKPAPIQNCNTHVCPPIWQVNHWSKCICDSRIKVRSVFCKKGSVHPETGIALDQWIIANDDECDTFRGANRKPISIRPCDDENEECVNLATLNTANVSAIQTDDDKKNETELSDKKMNELDDLLNELATVPPLRKCEITYAYKWIVSNWTQCDSRCGEGSQNRTVKCIEIDPTTGRTINENRILPDLYCRHETKPESLRKCNDFPCIGVDWIVSEWSKCTQENITSSNDESTTEAINVDVKPNIEYLRNQTKLSTIQTRTVKCATKFGTIYEDKLCGLSRKPETRRKCEKKQEVAQWFTSQWSSCSEIECGSGIRTRTVVCAVADNNGELIKIVNENDCNENLKPICEEECTGKQEICNELILVSSKWTSCLDRCEQSRTVVCLKKNETTNSYEPLECKDKNGGFELRRKCESDSVDTQCNEDDLAKNCTNTEFGCCPYPGEGEVAQGPNFKGCSPKLNEECEKSEYGCCQHSKSEAFGPFQLGCILDCSLTRYGCYPDNKTIALDSELKNCLPLCTSTEFGCCLNNSTAIDSEKSNCVENAKKPKEKLADEEECEDVIEGSGSIDEIEGSGSSIDEIDQKPKKVCKKKIVCKSTKYGCCDDQVTIKLDENGLGCNTSNVEINCETNPDQEGCSKASVVDSDSCQLSQFGCCLDGTTKATGENLQGCGCTTSPNGCCPDGISEATGPNFEGCNDCRRSKFGCCFDNKTSARSVTEDGKLDCPCDATEFKCCPDRLTTAAGPNFAGCPCDSLTYGCCPNSEIPATGPRFEGCDCLVSPHGCCRDGKSVALGPRFLGCPDGPSFDLESSALACSLPKERGPCRNFSVKYFFDKDYGGCSRFWYGGCGGNGNRFSTSDECESICMKPKGNDACQLPIVKGSCTQEKLYWGYNVQKHICEQFTYGGCLGNNNRFESREACENTCYYSESNDPCEQPLSPGERGRCGQDLTGGSYQRYYFNKELLRCEPFVYSGCMGNRNNFFTEMECKNRCGVRTAKDICVLPVATGSCLGDFPRYYFDYNSGACREFKFSGCEGNKNRFVDKESCERLCNSTLIYNPVYTNEIDNRNPQQPSSMITVPFEDKKSSDISATLSTLYYICNNNKDVGGCDASILKWYFNPFEKKCQKFYWSGCEGNANRFDSQYECESRCVHQLSSYIRKQQEILIRQQQKIIEEQKEQRRQQLEKQISLKQNVCLQPRETGACYNFVIRYYYDKDDKGCHKFYWSGCNNNGNNFATFEECTQRCGTPVISDSSISRTQLVTDDRTQIFRTEDCFLPAEKGPCDNDQQKWFYDSQDGVCKTFYWSSCGGNNNRFDNGAECIQKCWNSQNICKLRRVVGPCNGNFSQWYFDDLTKECLEFKYGGCQGNANRFSSKEMCLEACSSQLQNNYPSNLAFDHSHSNKNTNICHLKPEKGEGREYLQHYYFDPIQNMCKMFIYSGVGGNENNFERRESCERKCADEHRYEHPEPTDLGKRQEICLKQYDKGSCDSSYKLARWFYDASSFTCSSFVYSGCGGNLNKFLTFDNCMKFCSGVKAKVEEDQSYNNLLPSTTTQQTTLSTHSPVHQQPTPPPIPTLEERPIPPDDCPIENCNKRCAFGIDTYLDNRGCTRCRCSHPCHVHTCPSGQRCAVEVYRTESGQALVQPICRQINKPGECPSSVILNQLKQSCEQNCRIDADCRGTDKCCNNGCANVCISIQTNNREENSEESEKLSLKFKLNDKAVLNCGGIPSKTEVSVAWNKDKRPILQTEAALQNRIQLLPNGSLLIVQTRPEDKGEYTCSFANRETSELVTKRRIIEVYDPVSILSGPKQVIATLNQPAILECNAKGLPLPFVTWWKDKKILPTQSSKYSQNLENYQLKINSVSSSDEGVYYCQAHNDHGPIKIWDVTLLLEFEPTLHTPKIPELNDNSIYTPLRNEPIQQQRFNGQQDSLSQIHVRQGQIVQGPNRQFSFDGRPIQAPEPLNAKTRLANEDYKTGSSLKIDCLTNQNSNITWFFNNEPIETSNHLNSLARRSPKYAVIKNADNSISIETLIRQHSEPINVKPRMNLATLYRI